MKKHISLIICLVFLGCGGGESAQPDVDVTGSWSGSVTTSSNQTLSMHVSLHQVGTSVSGYFQMGNGVYGNISGAVSGNSLNAVLTPTSADCAGAATGTGVVGKDCPPLSLCFPSINFSYDGVFTGSSACTESQKGTCQLTWQVILPL